MAETHVISALRAKRAEVSGLLADAEKRAKCLRTDLEHIDCTIKLLAPGSLPESIPAKRIYRHKIPSILYGEIPKLCLNILRRAGCPISVDDMAATIIREKALDTSDEQLKAVVTQKVFEALKSQRKRGLVEKNPIRGDNRWSLVE